MGVIKSRVLVEFDSRPFSVYRQRRKTGTFGVYLKLHNIPIQLAW